MQIALNTEAIQKVIDDYAAAGSFTMDEKIYPPDSEPKHPFNPHNTLQVL